MAHYILGLDAGNTVIKAIVFDLEGNELAVASEDGHSSMPAPGHVERDLDELWANAQRVIRRCVAAAGIDPADIRAIGCAGHGNGLYALDRDHAPLIGIQSIDTRGGETVRAWQGTDVGDRAFALSRQKPWSAQTPTLLAWLKHNRPDLFARIGTVFLCKDYVVWRLTGERVSDVSDMAGCGLLQVPERSYSDELMAAYGLGDCLQLLPHLLESDAIAGHVTADVAAATGLVAGTPVIAGLFDVVASAIGSGVTATGGASIIAGTWSINQVVTDEAPNDPAIFMLSTFDRQRWLAIESSATSAVNLEWMVREFFDHNDGGASFQACSALVAATDPRDEMPIYHPFLFGAQQDGQARAGYYGIIGWHTKGHMLRALFEGVAFEHRRHIETLVAAGAHFSEAVLSGGGSRSSVWPQIFADLLGVPVTVARSRETGALGAAIAAGTGVGLFASFSEGAARMTSVASRFEPDPSLKPVYDRRYADFLELGRAMQPIWARMAKDVAA